MQLSDPGISEEDTSEARAQRAIENVETMPLTSDGR